MAWRKGATCDLQQVWHRDNWWGAKYNALLSASATGAALGDMYHHNLGALLP